jgi:hypothetical protein
MQKQIAIGICTVILIAALATCGPVAPVGLGPAVDPFVGPAVLIVLLVGAVWVAKSLLRPQTSQAARRPLRSGGGGDATGLGRIFTSRSQVVQYFEILPAIDLSSCIPLP